MTRKLNHIRIIKAKHFLEPTSNRLQHLLTLRLSPSILIARNALADGSSPQSNTVESLANVDHNTHDLVIGIVLESLADSGQLGVKPQIIDGDGALVAELEGPFSTVLVLGIFPFWTDAFLEEVIVCFQAEFGGRCDVILW